jgi:hypothetical protein
VEPLTRGYRPQIPVLSALCPQLNMLNLPKKNPGYATDEMCGTEYVVIAAAVVIVIVIVVVIIIIII